MTNTERRARVKAGSSRPCLRDLGWRLGLNCILLKADEGWDSAGCPVRTVNNSINKAAKGHRWNRGCEDRVGAEVSEGKGPGAEPAGGTEVPAGPCAGMGRMKPGPSAAGGGVRCEQTTAARPGPVALICPPRSHTRKTIVPERLLLGTGQAVPGCPAGQGALVRPRPRSFSPLPGPGGWSEVQILGWRRLGAHARGQCWAGSPGGLGSKVGLGSEPEGEGLAPGAARGGDLPGPERSRMLSCPAPPPWPSQWPWAQRGGMLSPTLQMRKQSSERWKALPEATLGFTPALVWGQDLGACLSVSRGGGHLKGGEGALLPPMAPPSLCFPCRLHLARLGLWGPG